MEQVRRIVPNIVTDKLTESRIFYTEFLELNVVMDMDWIITLASPDNPTAQISLVQAREKLVSETNFSLTIEVNDVDAAYERAIVNEIKIIYPLTNEVWGVRRFHVVDPNGVVINIMNHLK